MAPPARWLTLSFWSSTRGRCTILARLAVPATASGINNSGQVVEYAENEKRWLLARVLVDRGSGDARILGTPAGTSQSNALDHQRHWSSRRDDPSSAVGGSHPFLWSNSTGWQDLGSLGGAAAAAKGVNHSGQVVGSGETGSSIRPFLEQQHWATDIRHIWWLRGVGLRYKRRGAGRWVRRKQFWKLLHIPLE